MANESEFVISGRGFDPGHVSSINSLSYSKLSYYDSAVPVTDATDLEFQYENESNFWMYDCDGFRNDTAWLMNCVNNNINDSSDDYGDFGNISEGGTYVLSWWQQLIWSLFCCGMVVVATGGNVIVVWIVCTHKRMRSVTNYFLVNLSIADIMVSTLNVIFNWIYMITGDWPFGEVYCKISNFVSVLSVSASVFTMMAISIDRYSAIMFPLRPRMSKKATLKIAFVIWFGSSALSFPNILYSTTKVLNNGSTSICFWEWPDGVSINSYQEYVYNVLILVLTYVLPISSMVFTYARIGCKLWGSQSIGECTTRQIESIQNKRRVVKMMIVVVLIFAICWLPYHIYFIVIYCYPDIPRSPSIQHVYLFIYWLAMSNSMYNPLIYCWMNSRFRRGFKKIFWWCPCVFYRTESQANKTDDHHNVRYSCSHSPEMSTRVEKDGLVHISLHTLTDVVTDNGQSNSSRHPILGPSFLLRKFKDRKPSAV